MSRLDDLEAKLAKATARPWALRGHQSIEGGEKGYDEVVAPGHVACSSYCYGGSSVVEYGQGDREAIIALRNNADALIAIARAAADVGKSIGELDHWNILNRKIGVMMNALDRLETDQ